MPVRLVPVPWDCQPLEAGVISESFRRGLLLVADAGAPVPQFMSIGLNRQIRGFVRGGGKSGYGYGVTAASEYPRCRAQDDGTDQALLEISASSDWTMQFVVESIGSSGANAGFFRCSAAGTGGTWFLQDGSTRRPWVRVNSTDILRPGSGAQWTTGQKLNAIVRFRNASQIEVWWDGRLQHSASHSTSQDALTVASGNAIYAFAVQGQGGGGAETTTGNWLGYRAWSRYLDDQEMHALARDELALYEPRRIWSPVGAGTTPVTADLSLAYSIQGAVTADLALAYTIIAAVQADRSLAYDIQGAVTADRSLAYDIQGAVTADLALSYTIIASVTADRSLAYDIQGAVTADRSLAYDIQGAVTADRSLAYSIQGAATADLALSYTIVEPVTADLSLSYAIRGAVTADRSLAYDILEENSVTADLSLSYTITGTVTADLPLSYAIQGAVTADRSLAYDIQGAVTADRSLAYTIIGSVQADLALGYELLPSVTADLALSWAMNGTTTKDLSLAWTIFASTGGGSAEEFWTGFDLESGLTGRDMLRVILAAVSGRTEGLGTDLERYLSVDGTKARITAAFDANNNRTAVTLDAS